MAMFKDCIIKTIPLMQNHVRNKMAASNTSNDGRVTGRFSTRCSDEHGKETKNKDFKLAEEATFPASFDD